MTPIYSYIKSHTSVIYTDEQLPWKQSTTTMDEQLLWKQTYCSSVSQEQEAVIGEQGHETDRKHDAGKEQEHDVEVAHIRRVVPNRLKQNRIKFYTNKFTTA